MGGNAQSNDLQRRGLNVEQPAILRSMISETMRGLQPPLAYNPLKRVARRGSALVGAISILSACTGSEPARNPILPDFHADPSVRFFDGKYWLYPSTDEPGSTTWNQMRRWHAYSSSDLVTWRPEGEIFDLERVEWADEAAFAPDAIKHNGRYYFFFPAGFQIGVATSDHPNGPFSDALGSPLIEAGEEGITTFDPHIFLDDGTPYLFFGGGETIGVVQLSDNLLERVGPIRRLDLKNYAEGIWVHKRGDTYYFTYPMHIERDGKVKQLLVYSTAASLTGPYEYRGVFLDNNSRNSHHSIIQVGERWFIFYHVEGPSPYERRVYAGELKYWEDGSIKEVLVSERGIDGI